MPRLALPSVYADLIKEAATASLLRPLLINRNPEPEERDVDSKAPIEIQIVDPGAAGSAVATTVTLSSATLGTIVVFDQTAGFHPNFEANSLFFVGKSPGSAVIDEQFLQLRFANNWTSEEVITVTVHAETTDAKVLDTTYQFTIADTTCIALVSAKTFGLNKIRLKFSEPVDMTTGVYGALRQREISGRLTFTAPSTVLAGGAGFVGTNKKDFLSFGGSEQALNNAYYRIANVINSETVSVEEFTIVSEAPLIDVRGFTGPYKLEAVMEPDLLTPTFTPSIVSTVEIAPDEVELTTEQDLSQGRPYKLVVYNINDVAFPPNICDEADLTIQFTAELCPAPLNRDFDLLLMIPEFNIREDVTGDLTRLIRCFDEVAKLLLCDTDRFEFLYDIDVAPDFALDVLLFHLGNPFTFLNSDALKRKALAILVETYKRSGIARCIERLVLLFTGVPVRVLAFNVPDIFWSLGVSLLGVSTILGVGTSFLRFSFQIVTLVPFNAEQQAIITEIANFCRPAHTHFVRLVEEKDIEAIEGPQLLTDNGRIALHMTTASNETGGERYATAFIPNLNPYFGFANLRVRIGFVATNASAVVTGSVKIRVGGALKSPGDTLGVDPGTVIRDFSPILAPSAATFYTDVVTIPLPGSGNQVFSVTFAGGAVGFALTITSLTLILEGVP